MLILILVHLVSRFIHLFVLMNNEVQYEVVVTAVIIPDDVVLHILSRLPLKSLFTCKSVCKLWYNLISHNNSYFVGLYNHLSIQNHPMILAEIAQPGTNPSFICADYDAYNSTCRVSDVSLDFLRDRVRIRASSNGGLLCCSSIPDTGVFYVCNPITRQFVLLPSRGEWPTRVCRDDAPSLVGLAVNLSTLRFHVVLAGYHSLFLRGPRNNFICCVFDSGSRKWSQFVTVHDETLRFSHMNKNQPVYVNGALHWLTETCSCILVLNLTRCDVWEKIALPGVVSCRQGVKVYLLEWDGCISVIQMLGAWMNIWRLEDYERQEWNMVDKVSLRCIRGLVSGISPITQAGEYVFLATNRQILVYNRNSKVWKEMYAMRKCAIFPLWFAAHAFRSTIFSCQ